MRLWRAPCGRPRCWRNTNSSSSANESVSSAAGRGRAGAEEPRLSSNGVPVALPGPDISGVEPVIAAGPEGTDGEGASGGRSLRAACEGERIGSDLVRSGRVALLGDSRGEYGTEGRADGSTAEAGTLAGAGDGVSDRPDARRGSESAAMGVVEAETAEKEGGCRRAQWRRCHCRSNALAVRE